MNENGRHFVNLANSRLLEIRHLKNKVEEQQKEIDMLKNILELSDWDEQAWKKYKKDNYELIELGEIK